MKNNQQIGNVSNSNLNNVNINNQTINNHKNIKYRTLDDIISDFCNSINEYIEIKNIADISEEYTQKWKKANNSMFDALHYFIDKNHFKDKFYYSYIIPPVGFFVTAESRKTKSKYNFVYDDIHNTFSLESYIYNTYNIKNLQDDFLIDFFNQSRKYGFSFFENFWASSKSKYPDLFKTFKGSIFRMMRNYFFCIIERQGNMDDFGSWEKIWTIDQPIEDIFRDAPNILKSFYNFNYNLWKIEDLRNKKKFYSDI